MRTRVRKLCTSAIIIQCSNRGFETRNALHAVVVSRIFCSRRRDFRELPSIEVSEGILSRVLSCFEVYLWYLFLDEMMVCCVVNIILLLGILSFQL